MSEARDRILQAINDAGLTITADFVPWTQSRHRTEKEPSLNWRVTVSRNGRKILETNYGAGLGHCPSYKQGDKSQDRYDAVKMECQTGKPSVISNYGVRTATGKPTIEPDHASFISCIVGDADALNYPTYEQYAESIGDDPDSRKGEASYRACLEIGLALMAAIGHDGLTKLRDACQDF